MNQTALSRGILSIGIVCILLIGGLFFWIFESQSFDADALAMRERESMVFASRSVSRIIGDDILMLYSSLFDDIPDEVEINTIDDYSRLIETRIERYREVSYDASLIGDYAILEPTMSGGFQYSSDKNNLLESMVGRVGNIDRFPLPEAGRVTIQVGKDRGLLIFSSPPIDGAEKKAENFFVFIIIYLNTDYLYETILPRAIEEAFFGTIDQYKIHIYRGEPIPGIIEDGWDITMPLITNASYESAFSLISRQMERNDSTVRDFTGGSEDWYLLIRRVEGSIEAYVNAEQSRNLLLIGGFGGGLILLISLLVLINFQTIRNARREAEFISMISHELKTPLSSVRLSADNLKRGFVTDPSEVRDYAKTIAEEERRLSKMIENILSLNRIRRGKEALGREWIDLEELCHQLISDFTRSGQFPESVFSLEVSGGLLLIRGNRSALTAVLQNLIQNGLLYSDQSSEHKQVEIHMTNKKTGLRSGVAIRIRDHGRGIPYREIKDLFKPFKRGSQAREEQTPGSGLGLSLGRRIAGYHRGSLKLLETGPGGSLFELWLPEARNEQ